MLIKIFLIIFVSLGLAACAYLALGPRCEPEKLTLTDGQFKVQVLKYSQTSSSQKNLILLPPTGGTNYIDRRYAALFCHKSYAVYILDGWTGSDEVAYDVGLHQRFYSGTQKAITQIIQQIRLSTKDASIGLLGTSLGGLQATVAASVQNEINAVFTIVAGGTISEAVATSDQEAMIKLREERKKLYGFKTVEDNVRGVDAAFHLDPLAPSSHLGEGYKNKKLGIVIADQDTTVPTATQTKLEQVWKPQVVIRVSGGHFGGIVKTWLFHSEEILKFFESNQDNRPKAQN